VAGAARLKAQITHRLQRRCATEQRGWRIFHRICCTMRMTPFNQKPSELLWAMQSL
jgi:hypothetical protein